MRIVECENPGAAAEAVANEILVALAAKPDLVLGLATGSTPIEVYRLLVEAKRAGRADFARVQTFNLDEYVGLAADHPQSYRKFMRRHLFDDLGVAAAQTHFPPVDGGARDMEAGCREFEDAIRAAGGIDIQLLGIGSNGHIGFNEPTSSLASRTRVTTLTDKTLSDNARFYTDPADQPQQATTMGVGTILEAGRIILQSFGAKKARAIHAAIEGPISSFWPASALQLHPAVDIYVDPESASLLTMRDYYHRAYGRL